MIVNATIGIGAVRSEFGDWSDPIVPAAPVDTYDFLRRFTPTERKGIWAAARTNDDLADLVQLLTAATFVRPDDPVVIGGMTMLAAAGLLTRRRADEILGGTQ